MPALYHDLFVKQFKLTASEMDPETPSSMGGGGRTPSSGARLQVQKVSLSLVGVVAVGNLPNKLTDQDLGLSKLVLVRLRRIRAAGAAQTRIRVRVEAWSGEFFPIGHARSSSAKFRTQVGRAVQANS